MGERTKLLTNGFYTYIDIWREEVGGEARTTDQLAV
jgi:hypothetical protein